MTLKGSPKRVLTAVGVAIFEWLRRRANGDLLKSNSVPRLGIIA
jgi:hypothetical protein